MTDVTRKQSVVDRCAVTPGIVAPSIVERGAAQRGFTLIEVLVALTLMALVSLISWQGLEAVQRSGERLDERSEETLALVRVLGQIERDLLMHAGEEVLAPTMSAGADIDEKDDQAGRQPLPAGIHWDPNHGLFLIRAVDAGLWQRLHWYLQDNQLMRAAGTPSYELPLPEPLHAVAVLDRVEALRVRVWVPGEGWLEPQSEENGDSARRAPARSSIRQDTNVHGVEIALHRQGAASEPYRKVVVLP